MTAINQPPEPAPNELPSDLINTREASKIVHTSKQTVLRWILIGRLTGYRPGRRWLISKADLLELVQTFNCADAKEQREKIRASMPSTRREQARETKRTDEVLRRIGVRK